MPNYYDTNLSARRLQRVYEVASPRVRQYLEAEIAYALDHITAGARVLELGCGYGRLLPHVLQRTPHVTGIDTSLSSLRLARAAACGGRTPCLACMDAVQLGLRDGTFDVVLCLQNGISAFHVGQRALVIETLRILRPGGLALYSSYADVFWEERLAWFERQAEEGLLGAIDREKTRRGQIVCRDGFTATTVDEAGFRRLADGLPAHLFVEEVDHSSLFFLLTRH